MYAQPPKNTEALNIQLGASITDIFTNCIRKI